jgi:hypothetical membrane protein
MLGPLLFAGVVLTLTLVEYPFMRALGWDPIRHPTYDWPSGLARGPVGWIMTVTFLLSGVLLCIFAWGLRREMHDRMGRAGGLVLFLAGFAMMGLVFTTDPTATPVTWHGRLHDLAFLLLGLTLIPGMILLALSFRNAPRWRPLTIFTWIAVALAIPTFAIKGLVFYAFLVVMLAWNEAAAIRLWQ